MISRFFKKKPTPPERKKTTSAAKPKPESPKESISQPKKILTAEGWKRFMMRKTGKKK